MTCSQTLGESIPADTPHAVSVSLPSWKSNVGYEEGEEWVLSKMTTGYPRFFVHKSIQAFAAAIVQQHGSPAEQAFLFPLHTSAVRCVQFLRSASEEEVTPLRIIDLFPNDADTPIVSAVLCPKTFGRLGKMFWQHTGEGISSRRAEYCFKAYLEGRLSSRPNEEVLQHKCSGLIETVVKGPRRYRRDGPSEVTNGIRDTTEIGSSTQNRPDSLQFVEERFGRNLDISLANNAKLAIKKRIAGALTTNEELPASLEACHPQTRVSDTGDFTENDIYLFPCGMNAIFHAHQLLLACRGQRKSISFGFPYIDTLKILQKFGPGCLFLGYGSQTELDELETRCKNGERWLALFCEFPGNPLLTTPDLRRIRLLADNYDFAVVVDETIGNFINVNVLAVADIVVSSLTKVFTGECNVMGGSLVLNPQSSYYHELRATLESMYEDAYWPEDAIFMERNSRDFVSRIARINSNAEAICEILLGSPLVKSVYYPKYSPTRPYYDQYRNPEGGYGGLLSVTFHHSHHAALFYDTLETAKGPSLGTNFTLSSPYVLLAHYGELDWAKQFGVEQYLVRMSVGLEEPTMLRSQVTRALTAARNGIDVGAQDVTPQ